MAALQLVPPEHRDAWRAASRGPRRDAGGDRPSGTALGGKHRWPPTACGAEAVEGDRLMIPAAAAAPAPGRHANGRAARRDGHAATVHPVRASHHAGLHRRVRQSARRLARRTARGPRQEAAPRAAPAAARAAAAHPAKARRARPRAGAVAAINLAQFFDCHRFHYCLSRKKGYSRVDSCLTQEA